MKRPRFSPFFVFMAVVLVVALTGGTAAADGNGGNRLHARLNGANEVPPADPDGEGRARFELKAADGEICWSLRYDDIATPNRAHIHIGEAGVNGGIVVTLFDLVAPTPVPADPDALESGRVEGCSPASAALIEEIRSNPSGYYCNIHNDRFPGGAIRGQLRR